MIVVCDASPIISLASIRRFDLLRQLYGKVCVPGAVYEEVTSAGERAGAGELVSADWVERRTLGNDFLARALFGELDHGESEAIALAVELGADLLLVDERQGRAVAARFGLKVTGVLGVLIEANARRGRRGRGSRGVRAPGLCAIVRSSRGAGHVTRACPLTRPSAPSTIRGPLRRKDGVSFAERRHPRVPTERF